MRSFPLLHLVDPDAAQVTASGRKGDQQQKSPVPPAVKKITDSDNEKILQSEIPIDNEPVKKKDDGQKDCKFKRIK